ncbi:sporulation protein YqfD [Fictibacillus sp. Mic-4]|uniref:sporulation protein YqfD n=1 Tax=Fictibacillus sp. Mic-4 TaxID=3132826 RepID=UPI003CEA2B4E
MKKFPIEPIYGYVKIGIIGEHGESIINECVARDIPIWEIERKDDYSMTANIFVRDIKQVKQLLKQKKCKIRFLKKRGSPFFLLRLWRRNGFLLGLAGFILIIFLLSNMVWNINVTGADPKTEFELRKAAAELGIKKGQFIFLLPNSRQIQQKLTDKMDNVTWIGVTQKGTTYQFQVAEKEIPEKAKRLKPRNLIAKKKAIIHDIFVKRGQPLVSPNDYVQKGQTLVSGFIGKEGEEKLVPAEGTVLGETWHVVHVTVPLETNFKTYTGDSKKRHYVSIFGLKVPVWGLSNGNFKHSKTEENKTPFRFIKWELPIAYVKKDIRETDGVKRIYTKNEAISVGKTMAKKELQKKLPNDAKIIGENILQVSVSNGKVNLSMHYQVIENIASEQPITSSKENE